MVASAGAIMPAPLAMPPIAYAAGPCPRCAAPTLPPTLRKAIFTTVSVVRIASAACTPSLREASATAASTPGSSLSIGSRSPIRPVEQTAISPAESSRAAAQPLGGGVRVLEAERPGAGVGAAGVQHDGADPAAADDLAASTSPGPPGTGCW